MDSYSQLREEYCVKDILTRHQRIKEILEAIPKQSGEKVKFIKESKVI